MKRVLSWLLNRWVLSLCGVLLLSLVLWFEGPLLAFDGSEPFAADSVRVKLIVLLLLIWAVCLAWSLLRARLANAKLMRGVGGADVPPPVPGAGETAADLAALGQRLQAALAVIKQSKGRAGRGGLYHLPWYMFVGAPGAGKTTALVKSGLPFPLADSLGKGALGGVGGTRHCDWWFTDEAVLLDTAGRYTTQDSYAEVDQAAWYGFLQLLRKHRRRRPINGVIVAISVADLLQQDETVRTAQAQAIRARIKELHERLGIGFPVYVMVTKCDLLAGFVEFFDKLGREERAQVWGVSFPLAGAVQVGAALAAFPAEFALLERQLQARVLERMQQERDGRRRALLYSFPQQFAGIGDVLDGFLRQVFEANRYDEQALLRGVYFSSGTQEGSPIDRVMGVMAATFGLDRTVLPPNVVSGRSYFITKLLREVIFREAHLAGINPAAERRRRLVQWGGAALIGALFLLLGAGTLSSYARNQAYVDTVAGQVEQLDKLAVTLPPGPDEVKMLPLLNGLRDVPRGYAERALGVPLLMRFGLYQGDKLGGGAQAAYRGALRATLLPRIVAGMEEQLRRNDANNQDFMYETLRVYLMLGEARHFDAAAVGAWVDYYWSRQRPDLGEAQKAALALHLQALLERFHQGAEEVPVLNAELIVAARLALARMPMEQRLYGSLKRELSAAKLPEFSVASAGGRDAPLALARRSGEPLTRGINGMWTLAGYRLFVERSAQAMADVDAWVLAPQERAGGGGGGEQTRAALYQLYFNDYIAQWDALLADVGAARFTSLDEGARVSALLAGADSPLRKFLLAAARETTLESGKPAPLPVIGAIGRFDAYKKKLERALGATADALPAPKGVNPVDAHFDDLHKLVAAPAGAAAPLDAVLASLKDVSVYMDAAALAKRGGTPPPSGEALVKLRRAGDGKPPPLAALLQGLDSHGAGLSSGSERERLNSLWGGAGGQFCRDAIAGRYPLTRAEGKEVRADDFGRFFAPGGMADDFFQKNLLQYVDMGGKQWHWRANGQDGGLGLSQEVLSSFQRAAAIRDAFFGAGGRQASLRFDLQAVSVDPALSKASLSIDGQALSLTPARPVSFQLPSGKGDGQVRFESTPGTPYADWKTDGSWAWFRMMDKGTLTPTAQAERYKLGFDVDGRRAVLELTASSVINPFRRDMLEQFRCVGAL